MKKLTLVMSLIISLFILQGCAGVKGNTKTSKINNIQSMKNKVLADLYKLAPSTREKINSAYGYAVFDNLGVYLFALSTAQGYGVAHNNRISKNTYMKMFSVGFGVGAGVKDFRGVFVFENKDVFNQFVNKGWSAQGAVDAAAKFDNKGGAVSLGKEVRPGVLLYQLTVNGLAAQATIQGTKFWKDTELNGSK
ncbi:MAG: hypothetical protein HOE45_10665 [Gammaproteobacteria bacterium]|nr:hypothetical protein [Gammaproteobacteria bacterium]MBT5825148.1 hypothetical protein [Gammaproteobacteria bacterium]MBT6419849.1 hypothetical protein [Gammaproteobacteria bacterium]MBT6576015.1 hypothetical protein [Gammaproteobacteria bacterium]